MRLTCDLRLRKRQDYLRVQSSTVRVVTAHFVFLLAPGVEGGPMRLGITATRKVGGAVVRNRAKRLVREVFRHLAWRLPTGVDLVVIVRKALQGMTYQTVTCEWERVEHLLRRRARFQGAA